MKFNASKVAFGRHETFSLRYSWLPKGFQALKKNSKVFESDNATVELGVGRNMVLAIRYWLKASQMIQANTPEATEIGNLIFDVKEGFDPYLEDEATIWLVHWLLSSNPELATSWYWFFNKYHKSEFTSQELTTALTDFVKDQVADKKRASLSTLKNDTQLLHRMYTQSKGNTRMPLEEALDSPLAVLRLVTQSAGGRSYYSRPEARPGLPIGVIGFAVAEIMQFKNIKAIPIEDLMYSRDDFSAPGSVFRLTENDLITKLEKLIHLIPGAFEIRETAGIHQLYKLRDVQPTKFLVKHYQNVLKEVAA